MIYGLIIIGIALAILFLRKPFWGLLFLVALIPFHAFLLTAGSDWLNIKDNTIFSLWKEFLLAILIVRIIYDAIKARKFPIKIILADKLIAALFIIALITILYGTKNLAQAGWGIRYDFELFLVYFVARALIKNLDQVKVIFYTLLAGGAIVAIFGIIQVLFLPPDFLARCCGYSYVFEWTPDKPLQASQVIPGAEPGSIGSYRIISTLAGPNQLGIYLGTVLLLAIAAIYNTAKKSEKIIYTILAILFLIPIYFTYSRSAWLAILAGLIVLAAFSLTKKYLLWFLWALLAAIALAILIVILGAEKSDFISNILLRTSTSGDHILRIKESLLTFIKAPWGLGVGKAGLVSLRFPENEVLINESWHFQILVELGLVGFLVYVGILVDFFRKLFTKIKSITGQYQRTFILAALAILSAMIIHGFFLHTWTDITLVVLVWVIMGIAINISQGEVSEG